MTLPPSTLVRTAPQASAAEAALVPRPSPSRQFLEDRSVILQPVLTHAARIIQEHREYEQAVRASQILLEAEEPSARTFFCAKAVVNDYISRHPQDPRGHRELGKIYLFSCGGDETIASAEQALLRSAELGKCEDPETWFLLSAVQRTRLLGVPKDSPIYASLHASAERYLQLALLRSYNSRTYRFALSDFYFATGQRSLALSTLEQGLSGKRNDPVDAEIWEELGRYGMRLVPELLGQGNVLEAREVADGAVGYLRRALSVAVEREGVHGEVAKEWKTELEEAEEVLDDLKEGTLFDFALEPDLDPHRPQSLALALAPSTGQVSTSSESYSVLSSASSPSVTHVHRPIQPPCSHPQSRPRTPPPGAASPPLERRLREALHQVTKGKERARIIVEDGGVGLRGRVVDLNEGLYGRATFTPALNDGDEPTGSVATRSETNHQNKSQPPAPDNLSLPCAVDKQQRLPSRQRASTPRPPAGDYSMRRRRFQAQLSSEPRRLPSGSPVSAHNIFHADLHSERSGPSSDFAGSRASVRTAPSEARSPSTPREQGWSTTSQLTTTRLSRDDDAQSRRGARSVASSASTALSSGHRNVMKDQQLAEAEDWPRRARSHSLCGRNKGGQADGANRRTPSRIRMNLFAPHKKNYG